MDSVITSKSNEKLKYLRKLGTKSFRDQENAFIIEGIKLFCEALESQINCKEIYLSDKWKNNFSQTTDDIIGKIELRNIPVFWVKETLFNSISTMKQSEGIICIAQKIKTNENSYTSYVLLEDIQDPYNLGTIIRTADAAGIDCVVLSTKTVDIYNEKVLRGSMGSIFHLPIIKIDSLSNFTSDLKKRNVKIIGTALNGQDLWTREAIDLPYAIVMGNESKGVTQAMLTLCDLVLKIPMLGQAESLNVSIAASIMMYDLLREQKQ
jgi:TrmH family RNA methyltransferase